MEVLLYRWSTLAQLVSGAMIMAFLLVLHASVRRAELRPQIGAWAANTLALACAVAFWVFRPEALWLRKSLAAAYVGSKFAFACLLIGGVLALSGRRVTRRRTGLVLLGSLAYSVLVTLSYRSIDELGLYNAAALGLVLACATAVVVRLKPPAWQWLAAGFAVRGGFAAVDAFAYLSQLMALDWLPHTVLTSYLAAHSSFDGAAEWMIIFGCVLSVYRIVAAELARSNHEMDAAREHMRQLAESDMLTGLANRRALMPALHAARAQGAAILFFDLNDFKAINDRHGHQAGDACLVRFAQALRAHFRPGDTLIRYAGDEFVVIAPGLHPDAIEARIAAARAQLGTAADGTPPIRFAVGLACLDADGDADAAVAAADAAMYAQKRRKRQAAPDAPRAGATAAAREQAGA